MIFYLFLQSLFILCKKADRDGEYLVPTALAGAGIRQEPITVGLQHDGKEMGLCTSLPPHSIYISRKLESKVEWG